MHKSSVTGLIVNSRERLASVVINTRLLVSSGLFVCDSPIILNALLCITVL